MEEDAAHEAMRQQDPPLSAGDSAMAAEIARYIANRAFVFENEECRAWALTDFGTWAKLAGMQPELAMRRPNGQDDRADA